MDNNRHFIKKFSIGISFYKLSSQDWINILSRFGSFINDIYFSPIESINFQTRRNVYNYETHSNSFLESELNNVLSAASSMGITRKIVLNVPMMHSNVVLLVSTYEKYKEKYEMEYVTTFLSCAKVIKKLYPKQQIVCSYNQGITSCSELESILLEDVFDSIVLGTGFFRNFEAFHLIHKHHKKIELLLNNGCMTNCTSFCGLPNQYCVENFKRNLAYKDINALYAECSLFPEELHRYFATSQIIDYYKLSTRPIYYETLVDLLSSYISGESYSYIKAKMSNYNLYARLAHFHNYYKCLDYSKIIACKEDLWEPLKSLYEI